MRSILSLSFGTSIGAVLGQEAGPPRRALDSLDLATPYFFRRDCDSRPAK